MCIHVYIYTYIYRHIYIGIYINIYVYVYLYICVCIYIATYLSSYLAIYNPHTPHIHSVQTPLKRLWAGARGGAKHDEDAVVYYCCCYDDEFIPRTPPPPHTHTQHTAAKRPAGPTHECTGPASTGPRRIATEKGRVSRTATGQLLINQ